MALIQDVTPPKHRPLAARIKNVHQATNIKRIAEISQHRIDVIRPSHGIRARQASRPQQLRKPASAANQPVQPAERKPIITTLTPQTKLMPRKHALLRKLGDFAQYPIIAAAAIAAGSSSTAGQLLIAAYFAIAILFRIPSRYSFGAALLLLVSIPAFQLLGQSGISENAAIYTYEFLVVGTVQAIAETWLEARRTKRSNAT